MLTKKGIKVDEEGWKILAEKAKLMNRSRNNLLNRIIERINKMEYQELLEFLYPTVSR